MHQIAGTDTPPAWTSDTTGIDRILDSYRWMSENLPRSDARVDRRRALGLLAAGALGGAGGCVSRGVGLSGESRPEQVSLQIKTLPADADPRAIRIGRYLAERLDAVGVAATVVPMRRQSLARDVLLNNRFDVYVAEFPERADPDFLRPLVHSRYAPEPGWRNPFGFADDRIDRLLERQRHRRGPDRTRTLRRAQRALARAHPFSVVAFVDEIRAVQSDVDTEPPVSNLHSKLGYLSLTTDGDTGTGPDGGEQSTTTPTDRPPESPRRVRMALTDERPLKNLNPLAVASRGEGVITSLLYDTLGQRIRGQVRPWLAESWTWGGSVPDDPELRLTLREGLEWHDGTSLGAADVAFTYEFLADTSLGSLDDPAPAPRFAGRSSLVTDVDVLDERTVSLSFRRASKPVARRALTVPVLPAHVWTEKTDEATVEGFDGDRTVTEAVAWNNRDPVGSGPLQLETLSVRDSLTLAPFPDHFLTWVEATPNLRPYTGDVAYDRLTFQLVPSSGPAVSLLRNDDADGTATTVLPADVPALGKDQALDIRVHPSRSFYHVGYNARREPLADPAFRRAVGSLVDESFVVSDVFREFAEPAASPLARHDALAPELAWNGADPIAPFPGEDGRLDVERARQRFRDAGYRYENGRLLTA